MGSICTNMNSEPMSIFLELLKSHITALNQTDILASCENIFLPFVEYEELLVHHTFGQFEWIDGILIDAAEKGHWIMIEIVSFCPSSVLGRLGLCGLLSCSVEMKDIAGFENVWTLLNELQNTFIFGDIE